MPSIVTFMTYVDQAEEAARYYVSIFKRSKIVRILRYGEAGPGAVGSVMTVEFELEGQRFVALNGGSPFHFSDGVSLYVDCDTQAEVDELSAKLTAGGGEVRPCGWVRDKFGLSWQVVPKRLMELLGDPNPARAQRVMRAMMTMHKIDLAAIERAAEGR